jgi:hypothetical protein
VDPPPFPVPRAVRVWRDFTGWRRTRPFWGGLFLVLSGLEFYLSGHLDVLPVKLSFGGQSFLAWLIPIALLLCGLLVWYTPGQRAFYGILGAAISVAALIGLNLGGFFVGMIFGIVGGALAFSWTPLPEPTLSEPTLPETGEPPDGDGTGRHPVALLLIVVAVTGGALLLPPPAPASAAPCPSPSASSPAAAPSGTPGVNPIAGFFQQLGRLLGIGDDPAPSPSASPSPSPSTVPSPCGKPGPAPSPSSKPPVRRDVPVEPIVVNAVPSQQITARLSQSGLSFDGVVDLRTRTGTIRVLKFGLRSSSSVPFELRVPVPGGTLSLRSSDLTVSGNVTFYTTQIKGRLFGLLPITYTPDSPPPITVPDVVFTDATVQLVYVHAGTLTAPGFRVSYL